ncbi:jg432, partial [Pararge aegeria aegeria]
CCTCKGLGRSQKSSLPLICLVPRDGHPENSAPPRPTPATTNSARSNFELLDEDYIKKHFKLPQRSLYLDPFRRPLITFPMTQEDVKNFNLARKYKINQQILDGFLDPSAAISAPSVFPYAKSEAEKKKEAEEDEEIIYILQLPDWEFKCPEHNQTIRTPRHSFKYRHLVVTLITTSYNTSRVYDGAT